MANKTVYPYGTDGELPSSIGLINDLTTGGVNKALTAEMGKELKSEIDSIAFSVSAKQKLISLLGNIVYNKANIKQDIDELEEMLYYGIIFNSISATYTQGTKTVWDSGASSLESLKDDLVVTGFADGGISREIQNYTLSGSLTAGVSTITVTYKDLTATFTVNVTHYGDTIHVPDGYTPVEYIATNGKPSINLGMKANEATDAYLVDLMFTDTEAQMRVISANEVSSAATLYANVNLNYGMRYRGVACYADYAITANVRHTIYVSYKDREVKVNGESVNNSLATASGTLSQSSSNILLAGPATTNARFVGRIYRCTIYRNDVIVRDLIPCRNSNNVGYMYDMFNDKIYSNATTGAFTIGPDIVD